MCIRDRRARRGAQRGERRAEPLQGARDPGADDAGGDPPRAGKALEPLSRWPLSRWPLTLTLSPEGEGTAYTPSRLHTLSRPGRGQGAVSYTHLRAHETPEH